MPTKMIRSTERAASVLGEWRETYFTNGEWAKGGPDKEALYQALCALPALTPDAVNAVIENDSWTASWCTECHFLVDDVIQLGEEPDYESATVRLCQKCFKEAIKLALESGFITLD